MAKAKGKKSMNVDFGGVEKEIRRGTGRVRVPEGDYLFKIIDHTVEKKEGGTTKYLRWTLQFVDGKAKGKRLRTNTSLKPEALWNLRNLIHAATGKNVAGKVVNFDPTKLYGKIVGAAVEDDEYEGKIRSQITTFFPKDEAQVAENDDEEDEDDEEEEEDDEEEEEEEEEEDLEEVDLDEL